MTLPELVGHRGAPRERVENTLPSFARALELGADAIELDVHPTRDGAVVVHHDATLRDGRAIAALWLEEVRRALLPDGSPPPLLSEVLELAGDRCRVYVEVKAPAAVRAVSDQLRAHRGDHAVHAFDHRVAERMRELSPGTPTGILLTSYLLDPGGTLHRAGARDLWQHWESIDADLVARVHEAGGRVIAWTVNEPDAATRLAALGVDALCTDVLPAVRQALGRS